MKILDKYNVDKIVSAATSAARDVTNKNEFFKLGEKYKIPIDIISGESEGDLTYSGVLSGRDTQIPFAVLDIGGGSTEVAYKSGGKLVAKSFNIGCVRLTELFLKSDPETNHEINEFQSYLDENMSTIDCGGLDLVAVAGTPTTLASLYLQKAYDPNLVDNFVLKKEYVEELIEKLRSLTVQDRKKLEEISDNFQCILEELEREIYKIADYKIVKSLLILRFFYYFYIKILS